MRSCDQAASNLAKFLRTAPGPAVAVVRRLESRRPRRSSTGRSAGSSRWSALPRASSRSRRVTARGLVGGLHRPARRRDREAADAQGRLPVRAAGQLRVCSCQRVVDLLRDFLAIPNASLPSPWVVDTETGDAAQGEALQGRLPTGRRPEPGVRSPTSSSTKAISSRWPSASMRPSERTASTARGAEMRSERGRTATAQRAPVRCWLAKTRQRAAGARSTSIRRS